ncbi:MAG TPA: addiction module protein [Thermoanaerobaculia bacterium]|jgi:putative addiction module component (TIGR02574 family)
MARVSIDHILELPIEERVEIVNRIWASVTVNPEAVALTPSQCEELDRRWKSLQDDPDEGEPWEDVKRSLLDE